MFEIESKQPDEITIITKNGTVKFDIAVKPFVILFRWKFRKLKLFKVLERISINTCTFPVF